MDSLADILNSKKPDVVGWPTRIGLNDMYPLYYVIPITDRKKSEQSAVRIINYLGRQGGVSFSLE